MTHSDPTNTSAFKALATAITRQHTCSKFVRQFGSGRLEFDARTFAKGTVLAEPDKPVANLLQEQPETVESTVFSVEDSALKSQSRTDPSSVTLRELLSESEIEQAVAIKGRRAQLFAYWDPTADSIFVLRTVLPQEPKQVAAVKRVVRKQHHKK
jgi:hypothetical protein